MPSYKLTYFDGRGRAELSRCIFAAAGVKYEDVRVQFDQWPAKKAGTVYGSLPELNVDGKIIAQSNAVARFLAREFKLAGANNLEQAATDQIIETTNDLFTEKVKMMFEKDEAKKAELMKKLSDETIPKYMGFFERDMEKTGFMVGKGLTVADIAVQNVFDSIMKNDPKAMDKFPKLKAHREKVQKSPKLEAYLKSRKESDF